MSRKGENIYRRKDNRWEGRYIKGYDTDGSIKYGYIYGASYAEAKDRLQKARTDLALGLSTASKRKKKICDYISEWMQINHLKVSESTYVKYLNVVEKHINPYFGGMKAESVTTAVVADFTTMLTEKQGLSPKTVRDILTILKSILKYARKEVGAIMPDVEYAYPKNAKHEMRVLTLAEQEKLMSELTTDMDEYKFGILLALITGMRIGELCALKWENVHFEARYIQVNYTMQRLKNTDISSFETNRTKVVVSDPKSDSSARLIPLTENAIAICKQFYRGGETAYVLTGDTKRYCEPRRLQYHFTKIVEKIGLEDLHFHTLRHTFATRCVEVGFEIKTLSEILGHSTPKITLERYVHSSMQLKHDNMNRLEAIGF